MLRNQSDELTIGKLVSLNLLSGPVVALTHLRSTIRRHVVAAPRTVEDTAITPQHVPASHRIDGRHRALSLGVEEHNPTASVRSLLQRRGICGSQPQSDHRVIRPQRTDRSADHVLMKTSTHRERSKRKSNDNEGPLPHGLQLR